MGVNDAGAYRFVLTSSPAHNGIYYLLRVFLSQLTEGAEIIVKFGIYVETHVFRKQRVLILSNNH